MKTSLRSRRMFLQGLGGASLAIPFLPSLAPVAQAQGARGPKNLVVVYTKYGNDYKKWFTSDAGSTPAPGGEYKTKKLSDIPGQLSPLLGTTYDGPIRKKLAILRGLDPYCQAMAHNHAFALTGDSSGQRFGWSIDAVLEDSPKFYAARPAIPALRTSGNKSYNTVLTSYSYAHRGPTIKHLEHDWHPQVVYDKVFGTSGGVVDPKLDQRKKRLAEGTNLVHDDFKHTLANRRIAAGDKIRLDNFMSILSDIQKRLDAPSVSCARDPQLAAAIPPLAGHYGNINSVLIDIEAAALACGTTRIVTHGLASYGPNPDEDDRQTWHQSFHGGYPKYPKKLSGSIYHADKFIEFAKKLDAITDTDGNTVLDNSIMLYLNEDCTGSHFLMDMPVIVAGGKGRFNTDLYIDYRNHNDPVLTTPHKDVTGGAHRDFVFGRPYNNFLITILKAFGLNEADYEKYPDQDGFGDYAGGHGASHYTRFVGSSGARNAVLPGLWAGA